MKLFLIRHAHAEPAGEGGDALRQLDERGRREAEEAGRALREHGARPDVIVSSPLLRARETARAVAAAFEPAPPVEIRGALISGATPANYLESVRSMTAGAVAAVGHMPELGIVVGALTGQPVSFRTATIVEIDLGVDPGRIAWAWSPGA